MALVLSGGSVLTLDAQNRILLRADVRVRGSDIVEVAAAAECDPADEVIDCRDCLVMPGLVNLHTHVCAILFRGLAEDRPRSFWSEFYAIPGAARYGTDDLAAAAAVACHELLLNGVTCIADRYAHMDRIGEAIEASGIRAVLGPTVSDSDGPADWRTWEAVLERWGTAPERRVHAGLAPHAPNTCSDELLRKCAREAERLGCRVFLHLAQSETEIAQLRARGYEGALAPLVANGLAAPHVVAAHCIYLSESEIAAWPQHGIAIAHCPASNIKIEGRTLALHRFVGKAAVGLGTDWAVSDNAMDLLAECRLAALVGKLKADDPAALPVETMLRMATSEGARALGMSHLIGSVEPGKRADLVVFDLTRLQANPRHDLAANLLYSMGTGCVRDVLVDGEVLVRNGRLTRADEAELARRLNR